MGEIAHVHLRGDVEGALVITEKRPGGELVIAPDTCWKATLERTGAREATPEELAAFAREQGLFLPPDGLELALQARRGRRFGLARRVARGQWRHRS